MNTQDLYNRINISPAGYGCNKITIDYRGKSYSAKSTNTMATDVATHYEYNSAERLDGYYTSYKQALLDLWNEVKRKNNLR